MPAIKRGYWVMCAPWNIIRPLWRGIKDFEEKMSVANIYSFHTFKELNITITAIAGLARGKATCHQIPSFEHPSMRPASSSATGILSKNVFKRNILKDKPTLIRHKI